ncbi:MAG: hypothetical protein GY866_30430 [Proteobacteria bacterium]|nr:hypothetical protein [Pseudomonadota bacterium]
MMDKNGRFFNKSRKRWDESAIDRAYENLIDDVGQLLDKIHLFGCRPMFLRIPFLRFFLKSLELMEGELLVQWKIKQENGLEELLDRQRLWLNRELRATKGFFGAWNGFCRAIWKKLEDPDSVLHPDPWKSALIQTLTDVENLGDFKGGIFADKGTAILDRICSLFESLYRIGPHHRALSFLNLIELGSGYRPEIHDLGEAPTNRPSSGTAAAIQTVFSDLIGKDEWNGMSEKLLAFWRNSTPSENGRAGLHARRIAAAE